MSNIIAETVTTRRWVCNNKEQYGMGELYIGSMLECIMRLIFTNLSLRSSFRSRKLPWRVRSTWNSGYFREDTPGGSKW